MMQTENVRSAQGQRAGAACIWAVCLMGMLLTVCLFNSVMQMEDTMEEEQALGRLAAVEDATAFAGNLAGLDLRSMLSVRIRADGEEHETFMLSGTVRQALENAGVELGQYDYTEPALDETVRLGTEIKVHRVTLEQKTTEQVIPAETRVVYTSVYSVKKDKVTVMQEGQDGVRTITMQERWVDGRLESVETISSEVTEEPVERVIKQYGEGAPVSALTGPDGTTNAPTSYKEVFSGKATGYSSKGGKGASGLGLDYGTVAVDPSVIPYGTLLYIASPDGKFVYGYAIATDTGHAVCNGTILVDLYYKTYEESRLNEVRNVKVYVVG